MGDAGAGACSPVLKASREGRKAMTLWGAAQEDTGQQDFLWHRGEGALRGRGLLQRSLKAKGARLEP